MLKKVNKSSKRSESELIRREYFPDEQRQEIYLIDFGLSTKFKRDAKQENKDRNFVGTAGFSSINSHNHVEQSRRDDLESLAYIMLYLFGGPLPWHNIGTDCDRETRYRMIVEKKQEVTLE
jgi:casein kinase I family protein HRR25